MKGGPEMIASIAKTGIRLLEEAASVIGVRSWTEEPPYEVEKKLGDVQIRRYGPRIAAETTVSPMRKPRRVTRDSVAWPVTSSAATTPARKSR